MNPARRFALLLAVCLVASTALSGDTRGPALTIRGTVLLGAGDPIFKARVTAEGSRRVVTTTDEQGRFTLDLPLPDPGTLGRDSATVKIWVAARSLHFTTLDGQWALGLVLRIEHGADGVARVVVLSNDPRIAEHAANAVAGRTRVAIDSVLFTGSLGEAANDPFPPRCLERAEAPLTEASATGAKPAPTSSGAAAAGAGSAAHAAPKHPAPTAAVTDTCVCRIAGTIETTGGPLREPLRLIVSVEGLSSPSDTVTLDMGSPRMFDLRGVPCGPRRLVVRAASGKPRFAVLDPEHSLPLACERDRRAQLRVVLVPR
jgi:hypothetical protein